MVFLRNRGCAYHRLYRYRIQRTRYHPCKYPLLSSPIPKSIILVCKSCSPPYYVGGPRYPVRFPTQYRYHFIHPSICLIPIYLPLQTHSLSLYVVDYLHRVGRTARAGKPGKATSIITKKDRVLAEAIQVITYHNKNEY